MADFEPPFGQDGERRLPTVTEREQGFACGPADRALFGGLFHRLESEVGEVIQHAGLTPTDDRFTQLREAIELLIAAATGGGSTEDYLLMTQARARLPIFPETMTSDGKMSVTSPSTGTVRVPGGTTFQHRGIFRVTTVQTDFLTDASKTYHLRWNPTDGFTLKDLASLVYNPTVAAEINSAFDSTYDDMLVARVITNSSNVPTVTSLANLPVLRAVGEEVGAKGGLSTWAYEDNIGVNGITQYTTVNINMARTPDVFLRSINDILMIGAGPNYREMNVGARALSRYQVAIWGQGDVDIRTAWAARA